LASYRTFIITFFQTSASRDHGCTPFPPNTTRRNNRDNTEKTSKNRGGHERAEKPKDKTKQNAKKRRKSKGATQRGGLALQLLSSLQREKDQESKPIQSKSAFSSPS